MKILWILCFGMILSANALSSEKAGQVIQIITRTGNPEFIVGLLENNVFSFEEKQAIYSNTQVQEKIRDILKIQPTLQDRMADLILESGYREFINEHFDQIFKLKKDFLNAQNPFSSPVVSTLASAYQDVNPERQTQIKELLSNQLKKKVNKKDAQVTYEIIPLVSALIEISDGKDPMVHELLSSAREEIQFGTANSILAHNKDKSLPFDPEAMLVMKKIAQSGTRKKDAIQSLGENSDPSNVELMIGLLHHEDPSIRTWAENSFSWVSFHHPRLHSILQERMLKNPKAAIALAHRGYESAREELRRLIFSDFAKDDAQGAYFEEYMNIYMEKADDDLASIWIWGNNLIKTRLLKALSARNNTDFFIKLKGLIRDAVLDPNSSFYVGDPIISSDLPYFFVTDPDYSDLYEQYHLNRSKKKQT